MASKHAIAAAVGARVMSNEGMEFLQTNGKAKKVNVWNSEKSVRIMRSKMSKVNFFHWHVLVCLGVCVCVWVKTRINFSYEHKTEHRKSNIYKQWQKLLSEMQHKAYGNARWKKDLTSLYLYGKKKRNEYITALSKEVPTLLQIENFSTALKDITLKRDSIKCTFKCINTVWKLWQAQVERLIDWALAFKSISSIASLSQPVMELKIFEVFFVVNLFLDLAFKPIGSTSNLSQPVIELKILEVFYSCNFIF